MTSADLAYYLLTLVLCYGAGWKAGAAVAFFKKLGSSA